MCFSLPLHSFLAGKQKQIILTSAMCVCVCVCVDAIRQDTLLLAQNADQ